MYMNTMKTRRYAAVTMIGAVIMSSSLLVSCGSTNDEKVRDSFALMQKQVQDSRGVHRIMVEDESLGAYPRWLEKDVIESRTLPLVMPGEDPSAAPVSVLGDGTLARDSQVTRSGKGSIRLDCAASTAKKKDSNRNYGTPEIVCPLDMEDITEWNRISCWVYVDAPGYYNAFLGFKLYNNGEHIIPVPGRFEGEHCFTVIPGQWTHIVWEVQDLYRDRVSGISANIMMMGETSGSASHMSLYLEDMRLEKVELDNSRGFGMRPGTIAYSHSGYRQGMRKQAVFQSGETSPLSFTIVDATSRKTVFKGSTTVAPNGFHTADFSAFDRPGRYYLKAAGTHTDVFPIGSEAYLQTAWRGLNFFFSERCGADIPGIHEICHTDVIAVHPDGRTINWAGGWHDAADLTQGAGNNNEAVSALLELAAATDDPELRERALEEARWGLDWLLRTRFGDGWRASSLVIGIWTRNIVGDKDDMRAGAERSVEANFRGAEVFAMAAPFYDESDPIFARWLRDAAVEDFGFAMADYLAAPKDGKDLNAFAAVSAARLYGLTGEQKYLDFAADRMADVIACLQMEPMSAWSLPLRGFFYEDASRSRIQGYYHQSQEHRPAQALQLLLASAPQHRDAAKWKAASEAIAEYYLATADIMAPYGLSPAAVYEVDNTDYSNIYHEGEGIGLPTMAEYNAQVRNGYRLADSVYLRRFPVAYQFRGFNSVTLAKAKAMFMLADVIASAELRDVAARQVEWVVGFNPFAASTIYGDGYEYHPLYGAYAGNVVGAVPVGIETFENDDEPYWPTQVNATYKEIWTQSTARMLSVCAELMSIQK